MCNSAEGRPGMAGPPNEVDARTSLSNPIGVGHGYLLGNGTAARHAQDVDRAQAQLIQDARADVRQAQHRHRGRRHRGGADARGVIGDHPAAMQMLQERSPLVHLAPDAGMEEDRDTFACRLGVDTQAPDSKLVVAYHPGLHYLIAARNRQCCAKYAKR
jgi:hypothetical protein